MDPQEQPVVIHIVYDGPPEAGKTTSVRALGQSFGRSVYTPEEQEGRTAYFDWLEHTGGRFQGAPIHCQIASVAGQQRWLERRLYFIERADAVVFVGDTSATGFALTLERLADLQRRLSTRAGPPVGVVFQANRRDALNAVPLSEVRARVGSERVAVVESVALDGTGVREAFVFAVRLALDRVRETLAFDRSALSEREDPMDVLGLLKSLEPVQRASIAPAADGVPAMPSPSTPSGLVWPPVEGRILLREAMQAGARAERSAAGDYVAQLQGGFVVHSSESALFPDLDLGRAALIEWARLHVTAQSFLSAGRCITLSDTGDGAYRLWQLRRREPSLRELFLDGVENLDAPAAGRLLGIARRLLGDAQRICERASLRLPCTLDSIGVSESDMPIYVGLVPHPNQPLAAPAEEAAASELASLDQRLLAS
ncbi:MAG: GTPase domain-containing protein [Polyangiaceae bacterium]